MSSASFFSSSDRSDDTWSSDLPAAEERTEENAATTADQKLHASVATAQAASEVTEAAQSPSQRLAKAVADSRRSTDDDALARKERIHRYVDQCIMPDLLEHQRATDGRLLVHLCGELAQFGGPEAWADRLPDDVFRGSVYTTPDSFRTQQKGSDDDEEGTSGWSQRLAEGAVYAKDDVPPTAEAVTRHHAASELPPGMVSWDGLAQHLHQLVRRLMLLIARGDGHWPLYRLPGRLQAQVAPVLYGWLTHWPLLEASRACWLEVVAGFHAVCTTRPPRSSVGKPSSASTAAADDDEKDALEERGSYTLPWKPLAALCLAVLEPDNTLLPSWAATVACVRHELPALCRRASPFFSADSVDGLWGLVSPELQRTPRGAALLSAFVQLLPYRHLCSGAEAAPSPPSTTAACDASTGATTAAAAASSAAACSVLTPRARQLLRFLLVETAAWWPMASWGVSAMTFASSLARAHPPASVALDDYAEPLFTGWLRALELPVGESAGLTGAVAAAAVSCVVRHAATSTGGSRGGAALSGPRRGSVTWNAAPYARLLAAFPENIESPLWRQLERWLHATSVLVRPGLPCTPGTAAGRVCGCYSALVREGLRRVPKAANARADQQDGGAREEEQEEMRAGASGRYWSTATTDKFVSLFLPHAVSAFQTRAALSSDMLMGLLYMSPAAALPAVLRCVDAGLQSPTEVAGQRRISAKLLQHTIVTLFTDAAAHREADVRAARKSLTVYVQGAQALLLSLVSPSTPDVAVAALTALAVAATYMPAAALVPSLHDAEDLGTAYAARVIPLFTERAAETAQGQVRGYRYIEAFLRALPPCGVAMVARAVLREAQNRDHGDRLSGLVGIVASLAPAEAWAAAELRWLPVLLDVAATDAAVEWAGALLAATVAELGERSLVRKHAAQLVRAIHYQLCFLTSRRRRDVAGQLTRAMVDSLLRPRWTGASSFRGTGKASPPTQDGKEEGEKEEEVDAVEGRRVGAATAAHVVLDTCSSEDVRVAVDFFNTAVADVLALIKQARRIRVCSPAAAGSSTTTSLLERYVAAQGSVDAPAEVSSQPCACESAGAVTPQSVLDGALVWLRELLATFEWLYVEPSPQTDTASPAAATGGAVHWSELNARAAWCAPQLLPGCQAAVSRAVIFDVVYTHVCLPLIEHHVAAPLAKAGVDLAPHLSALLPSYAAVTSGDSATALWRGDSVVDWGGVCSVLFWLMSSQVNFPRLLRCSEQSSYDTWRKLVARCPACRSRRRLPLEAWASRVLQLSIEAASAGYLPVSQATLSRALVVLQCMCLAPRGAVRSTSLSLVSRPGILDVLDAASVELLVRRQLALTAAVLARSSAVQAQQLLGTRGEGHRDATPPGGAAVDAAAVVHTLRESSSGAVLFLAVLLSGDCTRRAPWLSLHILRAILREAEGLHSASMPRVLPLLRQRPVGSRAAAGGTLTTRSPSSVSDLLQLAGAVAASHPARAAVVLTRALGLYWPSAHQHLPMEAVRQLTRMSLSPHVEVRAKATEMLRAVAVHVAAPESAVVVVRLAESLPAVTTAAAAASAGSGAEGRYLLLSPEGVRGLDGKDKEAYEGAVRAVQDRLAALRRALPTWPFAMRYIGPVFLPSFLAVPASAVAAAGLDMVSEADLAASTTSYLRTPSLPQRLARATPPDCETYKEQWETLLLGGGSGDAVSNHSGNSAALTAPPVAGAPSWALRALTLPVERPLRGAVQEAAPSALFRILGTVSAQGPQAADRVERLLAWAETAQQQQQRCRGTYSAHAASGPASAASVEPAAAESTALPAADRVGGGVDGDGATARSPAAAPQSAGEDALYRHFLSLSAVTAAVVQLTARSPPSPAAAVVELRSRALRLLLSLLSSLCSDAEIPHAMTRSMLVLIVEAVRYSMSVDELWRTLSSLTATLQSGAGDEGGGEAEETKGSRSGGDTWSQQQLRLLLLIETLVLLLPRLVTAALHPQLVQLMRHHRGLFFMPLADQVRRSAARLLSHLLAMSPGLDSAAAATDGASTAVVVEYHAAAASARQLFVSLLQAANGRVFENSLPFTSVHTDIVSSSSSPNSPALTAVTAAPHNATLPSVSVPPPGPDGLALLTTTALVLQSVPPDMLTEDASADLLMLLCRCLDFSFLLAQQLHESAEAALILLATAWRAKPAAHALLEQLCAVCTGTAGYGASRRSRTACTRALRLLLFANLHRIGKYAVMQRVCEAALTSLGDRDAGVRSEGAQLFAVLTKVASAAQTRVMVRTLEAEYRQLSRNAAAAPSTPAPPNATSSPAPAAVATADAQTRRFAIVQALGAAVLADPGAPSAYVPKLMETLASCAREGNTECGRFAKRVFEQWWHAHREGWGHEYKRCFTAEQVESMSDLLLAPRYYA